MKTTSKDLNLQKVAGKTLPVFVERGEDGYYVVECPALDGAFTMGKTLDEALLNIREVIELILEDTEAQELLKGYSPKELSLHTITL